MINIIKSLIMLIGFMTLFYTQSIASQNYEYRFCGWSDPPFIIGKEDQEEIIAGGLATTYFHKLFDRMDGINARMIRIPFKRCLRDVELGIMDGSFLVAIHEGRAEYMVYTDQPYARMPQVFFYNKKRFPNGFKWSKPEDISPYLLGLMHGTKINPAFNKLIANGTIKVSRAVTHKQNFTKLARGRVDIVSMNIRSGITIIKELGIENEIGYAPSPVIREIAYFLSVSKKSPKGLELLPKINAEMKAMEEDGTTQSIFLPKEEMGNLLNQYKE